nr:hypothetical protein [Bacillus sp. 123MFChir2]
MTGFFPIMMFGLPAAKPEKCKAVTGMLIGLALTSFLDTSVQVIIRINVESVADDMKKHV